MSATSNEQGRDAARAAEEAARAGSDPGSAGSLDKVRDILFGVQAREFERKFARLEERLVKETNDLKEDVRRRLDALEGYARSEFESQADRLKAEHDGRVEAASDLARELKETAKALERRAAGLDEQLAKAQRELRQQMLDQHQRLSDDLQQKVSDVLARLARDAHELRTDKTDRALLASLLTEMAMRLTDGLADGADDGGRD